MPIKLIRPLSLRTRIAGAVVIFAVAVLLGLPVLYAMALAALPALLLP